MRCFLLMLAALGPTFMQAQQIITTGKIQFERKENLHKQFTDNSSWSEEMKKRLPKYRVDQFQLAFNRNRSLYTLLQEDENVNFNWWKVAYNNTVGTDYVYARMRADKNIYEKSYRVEDTLPVFNWKMQGEYREIVGFNCRKASTIIMDSLYIIAFYTDEIAVSGGPESFQGLPGMILGIVIPRMNLTLFATKVEMMPLAETDTAMPEAGKRAKTHTRKGFIDELMSALKDWGEYATKVYWKAIL